METRKPVGHHAALFALHRLGDRGPFTVPLQPERNGSIAAAKHWCLCENCRRDDYDLTIKICDLQGRLLQPNGSADMDGLAGRKIASWVLRIDPNHSDWRIDVFARDFLPFLQGHESFPVTRRCSDEGQIEARLMSR